MSRGVAHLICNPGLLVLIFHRVPPAVIYRLFPSLSPKAQFVVSSRGIGANVNSFPLALKT